MARPLKVVDETASVTGVLSAQSKFAESTAVSITDARPTSASDSPAAGDSSTLGDSVATGSGDDAFSDAAVIVAKRNMAADYTSASAGGVMIGASCGQAADIIPAECFGRMDGRRIKNIFSRGHREIRFHNFRRE